MTKIRISMTARLKLRPFRTDPSSAESLLVMTIPLLPAGLRERKARPVGGSIILQIFLGPLVDAIQSLLQVRDRIGGAEAQMAFAIGAECGS